LIDEKYSVLLFIKQGSNAETYRVKGKDGKLYFVNCGILNIKVYGKE
jgi:hypothetical protein